MAEVSLKNITKIFPGNVVAVQDVSLGIDNKEFVVFVGPSGCGKSTTLRIVAGLEKATEGEVWIGKRKVNDIPAKNRDIAMVFQNYALYPHMTAYENLSFALRLRKFPKSEIDSRVKDAAEILGITKLLNRRPRELSGGQRQRVAVGRAIVRKPMVFLFDEPLSNLDAKMRVQMRTELNKLHIRLQSTMIYVTHDQTEAMTMGNRIVVMKDGLIQQVADPITLYNNPVNKFVAGFIGSPPMNFVNGKIIKQGDKFFFNEGRFRLKIVEDMYEKISPYEGRDLVFGIRPEDIYDKLFVSSASPDNTIKAVVEIVEPMGAEVFLYIKAGNSSFIARVGGRDKPEVGQDMDLVFDMSNVHFFNKDTEAIIV
ncbi:MAG: sn-glycerol-3-phosphate ABC transporter ATP-binding protein UgpC [Candidatus Omnitrophota bacterium]